jgi:hypothetical protein
MTEQRLVLAELLEKGRRPARAIFCEPWRRL